MRERLNNQEGFTLVEIIAVLILLGILAAVAVPKYIDLTTNAQIRALQAGIAELNGRENMVWANIKLSDTGWTTDAALILDADYDTNLNPAGVTDYDWAAGPTGAGGTLRFQQTATVVLTRNASTLTSPGSWHE